jgi:alpha-tubulin suppressor-like RCC1 family protein
MWYSCGSGAAGVLCSKKDGDIARFEPILSNVREIVAVGGKHTIAYNKDDQLVGFGSCELGQFGNSVSENKDEVETSFKSVPIEIPNFVSVALVTCGWEFTVIQTTDHVLYSSGLNTNGQLGLGDEFSRFKFSKIEHFKSISVYACVTHVLAIGFDDHQLYSWGSNKHGAVCPTLASKSSVSYPIRVVDEGIGATLEYTQVVGGLNHSAALSKCGQVLTWGSNRFGQCGIETGNVPTACRSPSTAKGLHRVDLFVSGASAFVTKLSSGWNHTLAFVDHHNLVFFWGRNLFGQAGIGEGGEGLVRAHAATPVCVWPPSGQELTGVRVKDMACGSESSHLLLSCKCLFVAGWNEHGNLGLGFESEAVRVFTRIRVGNGVSEEAESNLSLDVCPLHDVGESLSPMNEFNLRLEYSNVNKRLLAAGATTWVCL